MLHDGNSVKNVILLNDLATFRAPQGLTLTVLDDADPVGPGWDVIDGKAYPPPSLSTDRDSIPADNATVAVVTMRTRRASSVTFSVNGVTATEAVTNGQAAIEVTATGVGPVVVRCEGLSLNITGTEVTA